MKELIRQLGEYINNYSHCKIIETIYYILCNIVYKSIEHEQNLYIYRTGKKVSGTWY